MESKKFIIRGGTREKIKILFVVILIICAGRYLHSHFRQEFTLIKENGIPVAVNPDFPVPVKGEPQDIDFAFTDKYKVKIFDADLQLQKVLRTALSFLPVEKEDRESFLGNRLPQEISTWSTMDKTFQNRIKSLIEFPEKKPAFLSIIPMDKGYLMVVRDGSLGRKALVNIFNPSGRFIIEKQLDFSLKAGICRKDRLYSLWEDEDGNQVIKCYAYKFVI